MGIGARGRDPQAPSPIFAPKPSFRRFRCSAWLIHDFAPSPMQALVFRSAYSASRNARASAAFAASIKAIPWPFLQNVRPPGSLRSPSVYAPKCSFGTFRCSAWLIGIREHTVLYDPKRSCSRFASRSLRCRTEPALRAAPVFRMAYFPYLTAFRMQAKQIQRLPLRGAGAKRLKGGPWG